MFDKKVVASKGKFDGDFVGAGEDYELPQRLRSKGYKFYTDPRIVAYYTTRSTFRSFLKQTFNYGVSRGLLVRKGHHKIEWRNPTSYWFIPASLFVYEMLLLSYFGLFDSYRFQVLFPFLLYWLVDIAVSAHLLIKTRSLLCLALPPTYFILHNVLGVSSLLGLIFKKKAFS